MLARPQVMFQNATISETGIIFQQYRHEPLTA